MRLIHQQQIVLCISPQQLLVGIWQRKAFQQQLTFEPDDSGQQMFIEFLQQHPHAHYSLLFNLTEEDYQWQLLPYSIGRARKMLLARKLTQFHHGSTYKTAVQIGREPNPPKKDIYLFAAVRQEQALQPWLQILQSSRILIKGAYLLPMLSEHLLRSKLIKPQPNSENILLCEHLSSGLRQTYFNHGRLSMSRLLCYVPYTENEWLNFYESEIENFRLHLTSQRLISANAKLDVMTFNLQQQDSRLTKLAQQLELPLPELQRSPELAYMQLLVNGIQISSLAPMSLNESYRLQRSKHQLIMLSMLVLIAYAAFTGYYFKQGQALSIKSRHLSTHVNQQQQKLNKMRQQSHPLTSEAQHIKTRVDAAKHLAALPASPQRMMLVLSDALSTMADLSTAIRIKTLDWSLNVNYSNTQTSYEEAILSLAISITHSQSTADEALQAYLTQLRQHAHVSSAEVMPAADTAKPVVLHGSTLEDEKLATPGQIFQLRVRLKPANDQAIS